MFRPYSRSKYFTSLQGEVCWGHDTAVEEANARDHTDGSGTGEVSGSGDNEVLQLEVGEDWEYEDWNFGTMLCALQKDKYQSGYGSVTIKYKNTATQAALAGAGWNIYSVPFACLGWLKVRVEA